MNYCIYHWGETPSKESFYGYFTPIDSANGHPSNKVYIFPELLSGGDYSGSSLVNKSNHRVFWDEHKEVDGVHNISGGHSSFSVAIRLDVFESNEEIKDEIESLENYCVLSSEDLCELEMDESFIAWESWGRYDYVRLLLKDEMFQDSDEDDLVAALSDEIDDEDPVFAVFNQAAEKMNIYWEDDGGSMFIRLEPIVAYTLDVLRLHRTPANDLPLLIGRKWSQPELLKQFEQRIKTEAAA